MCYGTENQSETIMDRINVRLEAARIAAEVEGVTTRNFTSVARRIEHYIMGSARMPEHFSEEEVVRQTVHEALLEMTGANDSIRKFKEMDKEFHAKCKGCSLAQGDISKDGGDTDTERKEDLYVSYNGLAMRKPHFEAPREGEQQHDPTFASNLMRTFSRYPTDLADFNEAARQRRELYHDMGIAPEPFTGHHPEVQCVADQETAYIAPGGMPCSEAESMYLQRDP